MPLSRNLNSYADVQAVLDQIKPHGSATYKLPTPGKARQWQMRAYKFRQLLQEVARTRAGVKGYTPPTDYDMMRLTLNGSSVEVDFHPEPEGTISLPTGTTLLPASAKPISVPLIQEEKEEGFAPRVKSIPSELSDLERAARELAEGHDPDED